MERMTNRHKEIPLPNADNAMFWMRVYLKLANYEDEEELIERKPLTNADRIRAMTDEELAEWIAKHMYCAECMFFNDDNGTCNYKQRYGKGCNGAMLDWLRQEAE